MTYLEIKTAIENLSEEIHKEYKTDPHFSDSARYEHYFDQLDILKLKLSKKVKSARGRNVRKIGDFKQIGNDIYQYAYNYYSGHPLGYRLEDNLDNGKIKYSSLREYVSFRQQYAGEEG